MHCNFCSVLEFLNYRILTEIKLNYCNIYKSNKNRLKSNKTLFEAQTIIIHNVKYSLMKQKLAITSDNYSCNVI